MATELLNGSKGTILAHIRDTYTHARLYGVNNSTSVFQVVSTSNVSILGVLAVSGGTLLSNTSAITFNVASGLRPTHIDLGVSDFTTLRIRIDLTGAGPGQFIFTTAGSFTIEAGGLTLEVA